jgi:hypothetical protein
MTWKRKLAIGIGAFFALGIVGNIVSPSDEAPAAAPIVTEAPTTTTTTTEAPPTTTTTTTTTTRAPTTTTVFELDRDTWELMFPITMRDNANFNGFTDADIISFVGAVCDIADESDTGEEMVIAAAVAATESGNDDFAAQVGAALGVLTVADDYCPTSRANRIVAEAAAFLGL